MIRLSKLLVAAALVTSCSSGSSSLATAANAKKITKGMNKDQVRSALGDPTKVTDMPPMMGLQISVWEYQAGEHIYVSFNDGKVDALKVGDKQTIGP